MAHNRLHLDYETYSEANLKKCGVYRYGEHPSTELTVARFALDDGPVDVWLPFQPYEIGPEILSKIKLGPGTEVFVQPTCPDKLRGYFEDPEVELGAWNAMFERVITTSLRAKYDFPDIPLSRWVCTMAKARAHSLPGALGDCADVMGTHPKDESGRMDMMHLARPRTGETEKRYWPWAHPQRWVSLIDYCGDDVRAERDLDHKIPDLIPFEQQVYWFDQLVNDRGMLVDLEAVHAMRKLRDEYKRVLALKCKELTGLTPGQTGKLADWIRANGYPTLPNLQKETLSEILDDPEMPPLVRKVLRIYNLYGMKAVAKFDAILNAVCADGRLRGLFIYSQAGTGRWCLTGEHEVLTPEGWKRLDAWAGGRLMCWDETGKMEFRDAQAQVFPYTGPLVEWDSERFRQRATPEHRMPVVGRPGGVEVQQLTNAMKVPRTGRAPCSSRYSEAQLRVLVMLQADGHRTHRSWKLAFTKERKVLRCRQLLDWLRVDYRYNVYPNNKPSPRHVFEIPFASNDAWLLALNERKEFPWELLFADHDAFFEELRHWDGTQSGPNSMQYATTNRHNADFVQAKAHLAGRQCNIPINAGRQRTRKAHWAPAYYCSIWDSDAPAQARAALESERRTQFEGQVYCPATPTGYFLVRRDGCAWVTGNSSVIVQLHNLFKSVIKDPDNAITFARTGDLKLFASMYSANPMKVLASCIRGMLVAAPGHTFNVLDFSAIEGRVTHWLAGNEPVIEAYRTHGKIYELAAAQIYGMATDDFEMLKRMKHEHPERRQIGKIASLSLGFGGAVGALSRAARKENLYVPEELKQRIVRDWREANKKVVNTWYAMEAAAKDAVASPGQAFPLTVWDAETNTRTINKKVMFRVEGDFLYMRLPSGRRLAYYKPQLEADGSISYEGFDTYTRRWMRTSLWYGRLVENWVQAVARDLLVRGMLALERAGYRIVGHVHDESIAEVPEGFGSLEESAKIMCPDLLWAAGLPIKAAGYRAPRYKKDD